MSLKKFLKLGIYAVCLTLFHHFCRLLNLGEDAMDTRDIKNMLTGVLSRPFFLPFSGITLILITMTCVALIVSIMKPEVDAKETSSSPLPETSFEILEPKTLQVYHYDKLTKSNYKDRERIAIKIRNLETTC